MRIFWIILGSPALGGDLGDHSRPHRPPALADREPQPVFHRDRRDQLHLHPVHVVPRHHHLPPRRQVRHPRHVRGPKVELRPVPVEERRVPATFLLRQHVDRRLELGVRRSTSAPPRTSPAPDPPSRSPAAAARCCPPQSPRPSTCGTSPPPSPPSPASPPTPRSPP